MASQQASEQSKRPKRSPFVKDTVPQHAGVRFATAPWMWLPVYFKQTSVSTIQWGLCRGWRNIPQNHDVVVGRGRPPNHKHRQELWPENRKNEHHHVITPGHFFSGRYTQRCNLGMHVRNIYLLLFIRSAEDGMCGFVSNFWGISSPSSVNRLHEYFMCILHILYASWTPFRLVNCPPPIGWEPLSPPNNPPPGNCRTLLFNLSGIENFRVPMPSNFSDNFVPGGVVGAAVWNSLKMCEGRSPTVHRRACVFSHSA